MGRSRGVEEVTMQSTLEIRISRNQVRLEHWGNEMGHHRFRLLSLLNGGLDSWRNEEDAKAI
jgi:hypothetical protein